jgi:hypothetical protein
MPKFLTLPDRIVSLKAIKHVYKDIGEFSNPDEPEEFGGAPLIKPAIFLRISVFNRRMTISYGYENEVLRDMAYEQIECALHRNIHLLPWKERREAVSTIRVSIGGYL